MEETYRTEAIILNRQRFREHDARVVLYSSDFGKLELVARGTAKLKSKIASHIEPINLITAMVIRGRQFDYLGSAICRKSYKNIKSSFEKISMAGRALNLFNKMVKIDLPEKNLFSLLKNFFDALEITSQDDKNLSRVYYFFVFKLLASLGYCPELYNCVICKKLIKPLSNSFSFKLGGLICPNCREKEKASTKIEENSIKILRMIIDSDFFTLMKLKIKEKELAETEKMINSFVDYCI